MAESGFVDFVPEAEAMVSAWRWRHDASARLGSAWQPTSRCCFPSWRSKGSTPPCSTGPRASSPHSRLSISCSKASGASRRPPGWRRTGPALYRADQSARSRISAAPAVRRCARSDRSTSDRGGRRRSRGRPGRGQARSRPARVGSDPVALQRGRADREPRGPLRDHARVRARCGAACGGESSALGLPSLKEEERIPCS
jgi:hypothetical protein